MSKFYKKLSIIFVMAFTIMLGCFTNVLAADDGVIGTSNLNNTAENSAKILDRLLNPEKDWKRYDDNNSKIVYTGDNNTDTNSRANASWYGTGIHGVNGIDGYVTIKFYGTKFRILSSTYSDRENLVDVICDDKPIGSFNDAYPNSNTCMLLFEKTGLSLGNHTIVIKPNKNSRISYFMFDAIDIDATGYLINSSSTSQGTVLNIEPEKTKIKTNETVSASLTIDNIKDIAAEDVRIKYDNTKLQFLGIDEVDGIKLVKSDTQPGELRVIVASKGSANVVNAKKTLLKLKFKGIAAGEALVDVTKGRVSDGITMEKDLTDVECGHATIIIEDLKDVNNSGEFTLLDLAIDARHLGEDPKTLAQYNTDIVENNAIDDDDLLKIGEYMLANPNYKF